jgi:putative transcriptional regulator
MAQKKNSRTETIADEMLEALRTFADELREMPAEKVRAKYDHRTVNVDFGSRTYNARDVKRLRTWMDCSQKIFADFIGVSVGTLRNWEQGVRQVSGIAARLFDEMRINPEYWRNRLRQSLKQRPAS